MHNPYKEQDKPHLDANHSSQASTQVAADNSAAESANEPRRSPPESKPSRSPRASARAGPKRKRKWFAIAASFALVAVIAAAVFWREALATGGRNLWGRLTAAGSADQSASGDKQLWTCGMHPQVIQDTPGLCPICNMKLTPLNITNRGSSAAKGERKIKYWWDPMLSPPYISDKPGKSPMGMDLIPVYEDEVAAGPQITIDPVVVQNMGVRVTEVKQETLTRQLRAVGYLEEAEPNIRDVNLRVSGWIEKLYAHTEGMHLKAGDPLFDLYSPDVVAGVDELTRARKAIAAGTRQNRGTAGDAETRYQSAARKLTLFGLDQEKIERLADLERAPRTITFTSPISGHITEKLVVEGAAADAGERVLRIVDHSTLWLDAQIYEQDLPFIQLGQKVTATIESLPGKQVEGEVIFIHPHIDPNTRTATVRIALPNPELTLRPGMYATVRIVAPIAADSLVVPREAIIDTGARQIVFISLGEGKFEPREIKVGAAGAQGMVQVLEGLAAGEVVVTSGQFLMDSESRLKEAIQKHLDASLLATSAAAPRQTLEWTPDVDNVFREYLKMAEWLGRPQQSDTPLDINRLISMSQALVEVTPEPNRDIPGAVLKAALAMEGKSLKAQRQVFEKVSAAVIRLADTCPPSQEVADKLFVFYCPMKKASWIQTNDKIANPFYATEMKRCGEVKRVLKSIVNKNESPS